MLLIMEFFYYIQIKTIFTKILFALTRKNNVINVFFAFKTFFKIMLYLLFLLLNLKIVYFIILFIKTICADILNF